MSIAARRSGNRGGRQPWWIALLVIAAVVLWALEQREPERRDDRAGTSPPAAGERSGNYEVYRGCTLAEARGNDGDSFLVRLPDGRKEIFRLYFVDTPESAFRDYANGETNHERIREQAAEMGGITPEQAVEIGKKAKEFTLRLLAERPFTIYTAWDSPFHDHRYHAHVEVLDGGKPAWLHRLLMERGLARLKTKPADLPDGTSAAAEKKRLAVMRPRDR